MNTNFSEGIGGSFGVNLPNFDPSNITADEVVQILFVIDKSGSVGRYVSDLNSALNDFLQTIQKSHIADKVFVQNIEFDSKVNILNGYQPIHDVQPYDIDPDGTTALYDAVVDGITNANAYKSDLEKTGISVKTLIFIISDGDDNNSKKKAKDVKAMIDDIYANESNFGGYTLVFFGVGTDSDFHTIAKEMGIRSELIATVGTTGAEIRKMISWISSSVSSSGSGSNPTTVSF